MDQVSVYRPSIDKVKCGTPWSALETELLKQCQSGNFDSLPGKDERPPDCSDRDRRVRAGLVRYLILGGCDSSCGARPHPKGVRIWGGWIDGVLDLEGCHSRLALVLDRCRLPERANMMDARLGALYLPGCAAPEGLQLDRLTTRGDVRLNDGFTSMATVDLGGARIGHKLICNGGHFKKEEGWALNCNGARIGTDVFLREEFHAEAEVNFVGARIGRQLDCRDGHFKAKKGQALNCNGVQIGADVFLSDGFSAEAEVNFVSARIGQQLSCNGGHFKAKKGQALDCDGAQIGADVFLSDGFNAEAKVNFAGAMIGGQLSCNGGHFKAKKGWALNCDGAQIGADVFLSDGFNAEAEVNFTRVDIVGNLHVHRARLEDGISFRSIRVRHGLNWKSVTGERRQVDLTEAHVGLLSDDMGSWTGVGTLKLSGFRYDRLEVSTSVTDRIKWLGQAEHRDMPHGPGTADHLKGSDFDPQPHVHMATVLRKQGDREGATRILVDRERRQRRASWLRALARMDGTGWAGQEVLQVLKCPFDWVFGVTFGYGHRPMRALFCSIILISAASLLAGAAYHTGQFAPNSDIILTSEAWHAALKAAEPDELPLTHWLEHAPEAQDYETFNPWLYGVDLFVPLDSLGQEAAWRPTTGRGCLGNLAFYSRWFFQSAGWIITALAAAVLTGLVGRRD
ncbi:MAG: hypothetical protein GDA52_02790 [Rhodobacteraceae bacterium]|nr:hypothetical protein [Paracoccaceae bacterium]